MTPNLEHVLPNKFIRRNSRERRTERISESKTNFVSLIGSVVPYKEQLRTLFISQGYKPVYSGKDNGFYY